MMKKLLASKGYLAKSLLTALALPIATALFPAAALAHTGHLANDSVHGFLPVEHIIAIAAIGLITYLVSVIRRK